MSNILYIANGRSFYSANPPRKIEKVVAAFRESGHDVHFICGGDLIGDAPVPGASGAGNSAKPQSAITQFIRNSVSEFRDLRHDSKLLEMLEKRHGDGGIDLVWERSSRLHVAGLHFARKRNIPYVMEWKDNLVRYRHSLFRNLALAQEKEKLESATAIVVESHILARQIADEEGLSADRFKVAFNAVDSAEFYCPDQRDAMREKLGLTDSDFAVGYVGSYAFYHSVEILCDAVKHLIEKDKAAGVKFVLVGDGSGRQVFEERANRLGVESYFKVVGRVDKDDVPAYLSAFDCAILPDSTDIICPIKVQEYMAAELPVLLPNYEANAEIITHNLEGLLFEPGNPAAIAASVVQLLDNPGQVTEQGKAGREAVVSKLSWMATWGATLNKVLEESSR